MSNPYVRWGVKHRKTDKCINGAREYFGPVVPWAFHGPEVFKTRDEARAFIKEKYGYIAKRKDLRAYPHGELMPIPVKIKITVSEATQQE